MRSDYPAILDACVLLPMPLADTLLRMAETPRLYVPKWSSEIILEVSRNLIGKFNKSEQQAQARENALKEHFPEAWVDDYELLVPVMTNDPKDRHVVAAAVKSNTKLIVTYNAKDFPANSLDPWGIERQGPSTFLINLYDLEPGIVAQKLTESAKRRSSLGRSPSTFKQECAGVCEFLLRRAENRSLLNACGSRI